MKHLKLIAMFLGPAFLYAGEISVPPAHAEEPPPFPSTQPVPGRPDAPSTQPAPAVGGADLGTFAVQNDSLLELYNNYRVAQPENVPWAGSFFPYANEGISGAADTYDDVFDTRGKARKWEKKNHSCHGLRGEERDSCKSWWGHCNAWSSAGLKEAEPRAEIRVGKKTISVSDQKGWFTEMWMSSGSLFAGETQKSVKTGDWIWNPQSAEARRILHDKVTYYDAFWDLTPRSFFLIFTNYIGVMRQGVVIDRFTGNEVWNQPVAGYRILPLQADDIVRVDRNGKSLWAVNLRMKIYWANDNVPGGHVSGLFDIAKTTDTLSSDSPTRDYAMRLLLFKLFVDSEVKLGPDGKLVSAGRVVGDGIWHHQEPANRKLYPKLDQTHPDFVWRPTELAPGWGSANPYIDPTRVHDLLGRAARSGTLSIESVEPDTRRGGVFEYRLSKSGFGFLARTFGGYQKKLEKILRREDILADVEAHENNGEVAARIEVLGDESRERVGEVLKEAGLKVLE